VPEHNRPSGGQEIMEDLCIYMLNQVRVPRFILSIDYQYFEISNTYVDGAPKLMNLGSGLTIFPSHNAINGRLPNQSRNTLSPKEMSGFFTVKSQHA